VNHILLVEDDPDDVELTLRAFRRNNIADNVIVVRDGVEALDYLFAAAERAGRDRAALPHLVLLDLKLPRLDGLQVLERIRAHPSTKLLPIVILTSSTEPRDLLRGYSLGANSYIRKPVNFQQFVEALHHIGSYWLSMNQPPPPQPGLSVA
jgi:two-component system response regulator